MATHSTLQGLFAEIESVSEDILRKEIAKDSVEKFKDSIQENVYDDYLPLYYERTYELKESVISVFNDNKSKRDKKVIMVYNDTSKQYMPSPHSSWVSGRPQRSSIPMWMNGGTNSPIFSHPVSDYLNHAYVMIDRDLRNQFLIAFRKRGYKAS